MKNLKTKQESGRWSVRLLLVSSAHGILICVILLGSLSWAWFTQTVDAPAIKMQTAVYGIRAEIGSDDFVVTSGDCSSVTSGDNLIVEVESGKVHDIRLIALGTAELYGGYCVVSAGDDLHYTVPIGGEEHPAEVSFQILFWGNNIGRIEFLPYWGEYPKTISSQDLIPEKDDILKHGGKYVVSGGDIMVSPGDADSSKVK